MRTSSALTVAILSAVAALPVRAEILIGVADAMAELLAAFGDQMRRGVELAVAERNAAGGVLGEAV